MYVVTQTSSYILIRIRRFHCVYRCHKSRFLVDRVTLGYYVLNDSAKLAVTASLKPLGDTSIIKIAYSHFLVGQQQGDKLVDIISHKVSLWVNNKTLVFEEWR